ncbi:hypothetical protein D9757_014192 [Collybiopsis confluens]|uniref:Uncharacterized protein n=1 Tax=Collybiopsis confluens TaxID=2823264 RepID=A0A8H5CKX8_9AGAR|nr:hypothetical protein D9757_014192 [Collybiopsis confluens]
MSRERRSWSEEEDELLRNAVDLGKTPSQQHRNPKGSNHPVFHLAEEPGTMSPSKWHAIAKHVPSRTNKDCRKRWFAKMASDVVKGGWAPEEDEKLVQAIEKYGTRWSLVSSHVQSRNSDQCAKRWTDTLNPMIDRTRWSAEADALLLKAVEEHGKLWTKIVRIYFPGRTGLSAKNRYNSVTRFSTRPPRRKTLKPRARSASTSSTVSSSPSNPPSFDLEPTLVSAESSSRTEKLPSDPPAWPTAELLSSQCLSPTYTYEELYCAMLSSTSTSRPLDMPWNEPYSHFHRAIGDVETEPTIVPPSNSLDESYESSFLSYPVVADTSHPPFQPPALTTSDSLPVMFHTTEEPTKTLDDSPRVAETEYSFPLHSSFWEISVDPQSPDSLTRWTHSY